MKNIAVMAGTFDPIHLGHVEFMKNAISFYSLDKLFLLVERSPKHKPVFADYKHRINMVKLAIKDQHKINIFESTCDNFPISNDLPIIKKTYPNAKIILLVGEDVKGHIHDWPNSDKLLEGVEIAVASRSSDETFSKLTSGKIRQNINQENIVGLNKLVEQYIKFNDLY